MYGVLVKAVIIIINNHINVTKMLSQ